jgi:hypothetical protein
VQGQRERRAVEINNHAGYRGVDRGSNPVLIPEDTSGAGIAIIAQVIVGKEQQRPDRFRDLRPAMRYGYEEGVTVVHVCISKRIF